MQRVRILPLILLSITAANAGDKDKDKGKFEPGPASSYATHQTQARVTIASAGERRAQPSNVSRFGRR